MLKLLPQRPHLAVKQDDDQRWRVYQMPSRVNVGPPEGYFSRIEAFMKKVALEPEDERNQSVM